MSNCVCYPAFFYAWSIFVSCSYGLFPFQYSLVDGSAEARNFNLTYNRSSSGRAAPASRIIPAGTLSLRWAMRGAKVPPRAMSENVDPFGIYCRYGTGKFNWPKGHHPLILHRSNFFACRCAVGSIYFGALVITDHAIPRSASPYASPERFIGP